MKNGPDSWPDKLKALKDVDGKVDEFLKKFDAEVGDEEKKKQQAEEEKRKQEQEKTEAVRQAANFDDFFAAIEKIGEIEDVGSIRISAEQTVAKIKEVRENVKDMTVEEFE